MALAIQRLVPLYMVGANVLYTHPGIYGLTPPKQLTGVVLEVRDCLKYGVSYLIKSPEYSLPRRISGESVTAFAAKEFLDNVAAAENEKATAETFVSTIA